MSAESWETYDESQNNSNTVPPENSEERIPDWVVYLQHALSIEVKLEDIELLRSLITIIQPNIEKEQYYTALKELNKKKYKSLFDASESMRQLKSWLEAREGENLTSENVEGVVSINTKNLLEMLPVGNTPFQPGNLPIKKGGARRKRTHSVSRKRYRRRRLTRRR